MAIEQQVLNTRIALKYDTYENWTKTNEEGKGGNLVLLAGEIGICEIPSANAASNVAPTVLFKVGNGTAKFHELPWASAKAADVYSWAKAATVELAGTDIVFKDANKNTVETISLGNTFATDQELSAAVAGLENAIGNIPTTSPSKSIVEYVDEKTTGIATSTELQDLQDDVDEIKDNIIGTLPTTGEGAYTTVVAGIAAAKEAGIKAAEDLAKEVAANASDITGLKSADEAFDARLKLLDDANTGRVKALETTLAGVSSKLETVKNVMDFVGAVDELPTDFTKYQNGDVIVVTQGANKGKEFVFDGTEFVEFGNSDAEQTAIANLQQSVNNINADLTSKFNATNGTVTKAIKAAQDAADAAQADVDKAEEAIDALEALTMTGDDSNTELRSDITELQGIVGLSADAGLQKRVATAEADIAAAQEAITNIQAINQLILSCGSSTKCIFTEDTVDVPETNSAE
jgi:hypothetical protein